MSGSASDPVAQFYLSQLGGEYGDTLTAPCPFCTSRGFEPGRLQVVLNRSSFLYGYFHCRNRCVPGGYPLWFARLAGLPLDTVPGYVPEREGRVQPEYPLIGIDEEVRTLAGRFSGDSLTRYTRRGIRRETLAELKIGFNGRYLVFPYIQENGSCYSARCVHPEKPSDFFWQGDEKFSTEPFNIFNSQDISRCENGSLFLCEGEENAIVLKQLGFPAVAVPVRAVLERLDASNFAWLDNLFICVRNTPESMETARGLAARIGYRARIVGWPQGTPRDFDFWRLAEEEGAAKKISALISAARPFSPFTSAEREFSFFNSNLLSQEGEEYKNVVSGFPLLDERLEGVRGINVIGGAPKAGKSTWLIQIATELARRRVPVLYYDFENGRQRIYQRTVSRLARLEVAQLSGTGLTEEEATRLAEAKEQLQEMLHHLRVVNDRGITPELMKKHIEFLRHETHSDYAVVAIDSLHKLPFKEFGEKRAGIDGWLREFEAMRDGLGVSFLVISELSRQEGGSYDGVPHMGVFKGSGDIEYSADNAMVLIPSDDGGERHNTLWLVASREHAPGRVAQYKLDYPFWGFKEEPAAPDDVA